MAEKFANRRIHENDNSIDGVIFFASYPCEGVFLNIVNYQFF